MLGPTTIERCKASVLVEGKGKNKQLLRIREGDDGKIEVNINVWSPNGSTLIKFYNTKPIQIAPGYSYRTNGNSQIITHDLTGIIVLQLDQLGKRFFRLYGHFVVDQAEIIAVPDTLYVKNGTAQAWLKNVKISGFGGAIIIQQNGGIAIGGHTED